MHKMVKGLVLMLLVGCVMPEEAKDRPEGGDKPAPGEGQIMVKIRVDEPERTLLGAAWAAEKADAYEVLLVGASGYRAVDVQGPGSQVVAVAPGVWRVLVLAGIKRSSGSSTALLVGSAWADGVSVAEGQRTSVSLVLRTLDFGVAPSAAACWKAPLTILASGKSRNPRVGMLLSGASTTNRPRLKSVELWNGYREMNVVSGTPDDWAAEATGTVPDGAASVTVALIGAGLCVQDASDSWVPTSGWTRYTWTWPTRADLAETHPLVSATEILVAAGPPPTGLDLAVTWE